MQIINQKKFVIAVLNSNKEAFIICVAYFNEKILIYSA